MMPQEHPDVPVVGDLRDMWKVTKLQRERKAKQERELALQEMQALKVSAKKGEVGCLAGDLPICTVTTDG